MRTKLQKVFFDAPPILGKDLKLKALKAPDQLNATLSIYGLRFNDQVYYCMAQGLLDPKMLEQIQNRHVLDEVMLSPSYLIKEVWEIQNCNFSHFLGLSLSNLLELEGKEKEAMNTSLQEFINKTLKPKSVDYLKRNSRSDWHITDQNIQSEMDRCSQTKVSFYLVLRWLQYEIEMNQTKKASGEAKKDNLLSLMTKGASLQAN